MNGIINVLKPPGMTSFDVVGTLRGMIKIRKIGHTGTLDPGAVGVLPICIGKATGAIEYITGRDKVYRAEMTLGRVTDTEDSSGRLLSKTHVELTDDEIQKGIMTFIGRQLQTPPMYSAVKIGGVKLYELAREGKTVHREPREVIIHSLKMVCVTRFTDDDGYGGIKVLMDVHCSKGTYIRTLCADIGAGLGCGGVMSYLLRTRTGEFDLGSALTLEEISCLVQMNALEKALISPEAVFSDLNITILDPIQTGRFLNGVHLKLNECHLRSDQREDVEGNDDKMELHEPLTPEKVTNPKHGDLLRVHDHTGRFLGLGEVVKNESNHVLKSKKLF